MVEMDSCPSVSRTVARSAPRRNACVPWEWRRKCGDTGRSLMPAMRAARLTRFHAFVALIGKTRCSPHVSSVRSAWSSCQVPREPSPAPGARHIDGTNHCVKTSRYTTTCYVYGGSSGMPGGSGGAGGDSVGGGGGGGADPPPSTYSTPWGTARLSNCAGLSTAARQGLAADYSKASANTNEYASLVFQNSQGNIYITDPYTSNSNSSVTFSGLAPNAVSGLTLIGITHVHWDYTTADGQTGEYNVSNWQQMSVDGTTNNHFSVGDEQTAEDEGVPIFVILGNVEQSFQWNPPPKNSNGSFNEQAPDSSLGTTASNYTC